MLAGILHKLVTESCELRLGGLSEEMLEANAENIEGFFESRLLVSTNDYLLRLVNASWDRPFLARPSWSNPQLLGELDRLRINFIHYQKEPWIDKDPRLCLLWSAYKHILLREPVGIVVVRNPLEACHSLMLRNGFSSEKCAMLWWLYHYHLASEAVSENLLWISDDDLMGCNMQSLHRLLGFLCKHGTILSDQTLESEERLVDLVKQRCRADLRRAQSLDASPDSLLYQAHRTWLLLKNGNLSSLEVKRLFRQIPNTILDYYDQEMGQGKYRLQPYLSPEFAARCYYVEVSKSEKSICTDELMIAKADADSLRSQLTEIRSSNSWTITRPLRWLSRRIGGH